MPRTRTATLVHEGGTRFLATTGTARRIVYGDDTGANELSPVETLVACIGAYSAMDVASICVKKRQVVSRYEVRVEAEQRDAYPQILTRVTVVHEVEGSGVEEAAIRRAIELSASKYCPVNAMISAGDTETHHRYVVRNTGATPFEAEGEVVVTGPYRRPDPVP